MKIVSASIFVIAILSYKVSSEEIETARAIQIVDPVDHTFELKLDKLKPILENEELKDRQVVVVSVAGAFRQGKSFLLNFFIKYLKAQYKKHDVSDWIGENENNTVLDGFKWRAGRKPETLGIWMWSEIFTHDYENGDKVAIIVLDTQGIFDDQSSVRDYTTIFALSMMLSSVQCYNMVQNILEDNLQHLELFMEYGRLGLESSNEKPFQKLLFVVRDWPFAYETNFGWHGKKVIDEIIAGNNRQTAEMQELRKRLDSSFTGISAYLMPHPGKAVAQGNTFSGNLKEIDPEFIQYVKEMAQRLFAPENLVGKEINGQKVFVRDWMQYLQKYVDIFNGNTLPEPKTNYKATAEASSLILHKDVVSFYTNKMQNLINDAKHFNESDLDNVHQQTKTEALEMFQNKPKLGDDQFVSHVRQNIEADIEESFVILKQINEEKRKNFVEISNTNNKKIIDEIKAKIGRKVEKEIVNSDSPIKYSKMNMFFTVQKSNSMKQFDQLKMENEEVAKKERDRLNNDLAQMYTALLNMAEKYNEIVNSYDVSMHELLDGAESYLDKDELLRIHQNKKVDAMHQFDEKMSEQMQMALCFQRKIEKLLDEKFPAIEEERQNKRDAYIKAANSHNEMLLREIKVMFENKLLSGFSESYLNDEIFINLFIKAKMDALKDFETRKIGNHAESNALREKLERDLDDLLSILKRKNDEKKPKSKRQTRKDRIIDMAIGLAGGLIGGALG